jgi:squalene-hopene/tetraprenyl-beta-curcumene cyclase
MNRRHWLGLATAAVAGSARGWQWALGADPAGSLGPDPKQWNSVVDKAIGYLKAAQDKDGSWSRTKNLGVTGIVVTGLLETGKVGPDDPLVANGLKFIESLVNVKGGHIAGQSPKPQLLNYVTSVNVLALRAAKRDEKYKKIIGNATDFLKKLQWDEDEGENKPAKKPSDDFYGGFGYDSKSRPDLSNTQFTLDALKDLLPANDPAFKRAITFVSRSQNINKSEYNDQKWASLINDGSFIYSPAGGGQTKSEVLANGGLVGYGSMTYAGIKSLIYCGVSKDDERIKKALDWTQKHYTLTENPGMPKLKHQQGLYYYYHSMAKCLDALGVKKLDTPDGKQHDWRADITKALADRQRKDGSWVNELDSWMEGDPNLVTGYALMTLSYCKPKKG